MEKKKKNVFKTFNLTSNKKDDPSLPQNFAMQIVFIPDSLHTHSVTC